MRIEKRDADKERDVLAAMIHDPMVLGEIASKWDQGHLSFKNKGSNKIADWCVDYFNRYGKAPGKMIVRIFRSKAERLDDVSIELIERYLSQIFDRQERKTDQPYSSFSLDLAQNYFKGVLFDETANAILGHLASGDLKRAEERWESRLQVEIGSNRWINALNDPEAVRRMFAKQVEPVIRYSGALGQLLGSSLKRGGFVAFLGAEKRGKSWVLMDMAWTAMRQRHKVAYFIIGDMSEEDVMWRLSTRAMKRPLLPDTIKVPTSISRIEGSNIAHVEQDVIPYEDEVLEGDIVARLDKVNRTHVRSQVPYLNLIVPDSPDFSVVSLENELQSLARWGWVPDCVVVDYADNLSTPSAKLDRRDAISETWRRLRIIAQKYHCLVLTATQANRASYNVSAVKAEHTSEDKRKIAHITGYMGLNALDEEKDFGLMRINWLRLRGARYSESVFVHVAGCLDIARPFMFSTF